MITHHTVMIQHSVLVGLEPASLAKRQTIHRGVVASVLSLAYRVILRRSQQDYLWYQAIVQICAYVMLFPFLLGHPRPSVCLSVWVL